MSNFPQDKIQSQFEQAGPLVISPVVKIAAGSFLQEARQLTVVSPENMYFSFQENDYKLWEKIISTLFTRQLELAAAAKILAQTEMISTQSPANFLAQAASKCGSLLTWIFPKYCRLDKNAVSLFGKPIYRSEHIVCVVLGNICEGVVFAVGPSEWRKQDENIFVRVPAFVELSGSSLFLGGDTNIIPLDF